MQPIYLESLSKPVQDFILQVEKYAEVEIEVIPSVKYNGGGTTGQGHLAIDIQAQSIRLYKPTNDYFPDGAVRHEVLHVNRFHVEGIPKLVADYEECDKGLDEALSGLDNAIEHVFIVPEELKFHPDRREHWERVMHDACEGLPNVLERNRPLTVCLHWTFFQHVIPDSISFEILRNFANEHRLTEMANQIASQLITLSANKEKLVSILFKNFSESLPRNRAALEYINSRTGARQKPIS